MLTFSSLGEERNTMELTLFNEKEQSTKKISFSGKNVKSLLAKLKINPETVIIARNNEIIIEEEILKDKDKLEILSVVSGG